MRFTKMHGLGNDYIYIDCWQEQVDNPAQLARRISDRHLGVGGDGLVLIMPSQVAAARMRIFNADGSEAEMCGNAIRCVAKYLYDQKIVTEPSLTIETAAGIRQLRLRPDQAVTSVQVDMGEPGLLSEQIPVKGPSRQISGEAITVNGRQYSFTAVSMGNPHCVIFLPEITDQAVLVDGPQIEQHPIFPNRINVEFVQVNSRATLTMRVWERGSGETMACGTGACAATVAAILNGLTDRQVTVRLPGGELLVNWDQASNHVWMTGPAVTVFAGEWLLG